MYNIMYLINPRCMHEGYDSRSVCIDVSVSTLTATYMYSIYLVCMSKVQFYKIPYGVPNTCIV